MGKGRGGGGVCLDACNIYSFWSCGHLLMPPRNGLIPGPSYTIHTGHGQQFKDAEKQYIIQYMYFEIATRYAGGRRYIFRAL